MSGNANVVILVGRLTRDPERREAKGAPLATFGMATSRQWKDRDSGEKREEVCFVDCEAWNGLADVVLKFARKGTPIYVQGRLRFSTWEDKASGEKRSKLKVLVETFQMLDSKPASASSDANDEYTPPGDMTPSNGKPAGGGGKKVASTLPPHESSGLSEDDIPF